MDKKGVAILLIALVLAVAAGSSVYMYLKDMPLVVAIDARGKDIYRQR